MVRHISTTYPDATINAGIGEHLTTDHARMDARLKGYVGGQPDITIIRGLPNGFHDVMAIELKNPNKRGKVSEKQFKYKYKLEHTCNVKVLISCDYDEIILTIHDHYKEVFAKAQTPAIADQAKTYNFATNENPQYWCNKLRSTGLREQWDRRGLPSDTYMLSTNRQVASILITFDKDQ